MTTKLTTENLNYVDEYYGALIGTERQKAYAVRVLQEYRSTIAYLLRDGVELTTVCSAIIDHRSDVYSYLLSQSLKQDKEIKLKDK